MTNSERIRIGDHVHMRQRGPKRRWVAEFRHAGQHCRLSLRTARRPEAERKARELEVSLAAGTYSQAPKPQDIAAAVAQFIEAKRVDQRAHKTIVKYEAELTNFAAFAATQGVTKLQQVTPRLHDQFRAARLKTLDAYTVYNHAVLLKGFTKWCESRELLALDPLRKVRLSEPSRPPKWSPPLDVIDRLLAAADGEDDDGALARKLAVLAFTGMRSSELQMLRPQDADLVGNWVHVNVRRGWRTKTGASRKVPIHPRLRPYLVQALRASKGKPYLFCAPPSVRFPAADHYTNPKHLLERVQKLAAGLGISTGRKDDGLVVHSLRHFFETFCINNHVPQRAVDVWLGHVGDRSTSAIYYQLSDRDSQDFMAKVPFGAPTGTHLQNGETNAA
jgi:integrase